MILPDKILRARCHQEGYHLDRRPGDPPLVEPYDPSLVRPASIDMRLGTSFRVSRTDKLMAIDLADVPPPDLISEPVGVEPDGYFVIHPGEFVLASTLETINVPRDLAMYLDGRSSLARLGLLAHITAGYFDPGFSGVGTLEFVNLNKVPIMLRPGQIVCQSRWMKLQAPPENDYSTQYAGLPGRYQGDTEAVGSRHGETPPMGAAPLGWTEYDWRVYHGQIRDPLS